MREANPFTLHGIASIPPRPYLNIHSLIYSTNICLVSMHATHFANYQAHEVNMSIWLQGKLFLTLEFKQLPGEAVFIRILVT